jgi:hypothetical protein
MNCVKGGIRGGNVGQGKGTRDKDVGTDSTEAEFLDKINTKVLAIQLCLEIYISSNSLNL